MPDPVVPHPPKPAPAKVDRVMHVGHVVDVASRAVVRELGDRPPLVALDDRGAYYVDKTGGVHAVELATGAERFVAKPAGCAHLAATDHELHCVDKSLIHSIDKRTGALRTYPSAKLVAQVLGVGKHLVIVRSGGTVESLEERDGKRASVLAPLHAYPALVRDGDGFCGASATPGAVFAGCWSAALDPRWSRTITLAKPGDPSFTPWPNKLANGFLVASTDPFGKLVERAVVIRLADGVELARVDETIAACTSRDGKTLDGLVSLRHGFRYLEPHGAVRFTATFTRPDEGADAVVDGERLFVAVHPTISVGSEIRAFDRTTGKLLWTAEPTLPPIAHSAYINEVGLAVRSGVLAVHGVEAAVDYVLLLDRNTGKQELSDVVKLW